MDATKSSVRVVRPDLLLLESSVARAGIPEDLVVAAFWWEYMRSSPAAVQAIEQACRASCYTTEDKSPLAQVIGFDAVEEFGQQQEPIFGDFYFPRLSWGEAMRTFSPSHDEDPFPSIYTLAEFWRGCVTGVSTPMWIGRKWMEIYSPDEEIPEDPPVFWIRLNWRHSDAELIRFFRRFLREKRPVNSTKPARLVTSRSAVDLPVKPRSALGWLFVQRAYEECGSWSLFLDKYGPEFRRICGAIPDEKDLMARRRRAVQIVGWFSRGIVERPR